jgi:hypothetical protein
MTGRMSRMRLLLPVLAVVLCLAGKDAAWAAQDDQTFYNQGQAAYDARDPERSRRDAIMDLKSEVLRQAVENLVDEEQMAAKREAVQSRIVKSPETFIRSLQIVSQEVENGRLRVAGQVVVNIDELLRSLRALGLIAPAPAAAAEDDEGAEVEVDQTADDDQNETVEDDTEAEAAPGSEAGLDEEEQAGEEQLAEEPDDEAAQDQSQASHNDLRTNVLVLWWVAEKWEQASPWHVPGMNELGVAAQALFAASIRQETQAMRWKLVNLESGSDVLVQEADAGRSIPVDQAKAEARRRNAGVVVIGTATQRRRADGKVGLVADLTLLDTASGDRLGEIHRDIALSQLENPADYAEEIIKLASWVAPELDKLVNAALVEGERVDADDEDREEATEAEAKPGIASNARPETRPDSRRPHSWTLILHPFRSPAQWEQLEQALRKRFAGLEVVSLELGAGSARVELDHVADNLPTILRELQLQTGRLEIQDENADTRTIHLSVAP